MKESSRIFKIGQVYAWTDWSTNKITPYTITKRNSGKISLNDTEYDIITDSNGNESILMCEVYGVQGYIYAR